MGALLGSTGDVQCHQGGLVSLGLSSRLYFTIKGVEGGHKDPWRS